MPTGLSGGVSRCADLMRAQDGTRGDGLTTARRCTNGAAQQQTQLAL